MSNSELRGTALRHALATAERELVDAEKRASIAQAAIDAALLAGDDTETQRAALRAAMASIRDVQATIDRHRATIARRTAEKIAARAAELIDAAQHSTQDTLAPFSIPETLS